MPWQEELRINFEEARLKRTVSDDICPKDLHGFERNRSSKDGNSSKDREKLGRVTRQDVKNKLLDVVIDDTSFFDSIGNRFEIVLKVREGTREAWREGNTSFRTMEATCLVISVPAIPMATPQSEDLIADRQKRDAT